MLYFPGQNHSFHMSATLQRQWCLVIVGTLLSTAVLAQSQTKYDQQTRHIREMGERNRAVISSGKGSNSSGTGAKPTNRVANPSDRANEEMRKKQLEKLSAQRKADEAAMEERKKAGEFDRVVDGRLIRFDVVRPLENYPDYEVAGEGYVVRLIKQGKTIIPPSRGYFSIAGVKNRSGKIFALAGKLYNGGRYFAYIDSLGNELSPFLPEPAWDWQHSKVRILKMPGGSILLTDDGRYVQFQQIKPYAGGYYLVSNNSNGLADSLLNIVVPLEFAEPFKGMPPYVVVRARVAGQFRFAVYDVNNKRLQLETFDQAEPGTATTMRVQVKGKWGLYDCQTQQYLAQPAYNEIKPFHQGRAAVNIRNKWGYIDEQGKMVIPAMYSRAGSFENGSAIVWKGDKMLRIDAQGNVL